ncbi:phosphatase [Paenibacillus antibioticophila]|uniref:Phosphatase n=1 Tax=Paenibacillus antibioticophila TaxID=1274374 RepID=A0A919XLX7_9BACL|nr:Ppx/GppA family phosphatase [Paenibacillus antibioticophila]GIO35421.1 phosphatase [Paenibacillus antibioticophila]
MQNNYVNIGIIDIGSNSIRLAIYESAAEGRAYRLINEFKESARLSEKMSADGMMHQEGIQSIVPILRQFSEVCSAYSCTKIRIAATAAIRNAANTSEIKAILERDTGMEIEVLTGEQEAYFGFIAVAGGMAVEDGFIVDIGGGSTEITLFRNRHLVGSVSLPLGAVNAQVQFGEGEETWTEENCRRLRHAVGRLMEKESWMESHSGLPLIGLGGTIRTLSKMDQRRRNYPLRLAHHYSVEPEGIQYYAETLPQLSLEKRRKIDGLSKARADIIVPGILILQAVFDRCQASCCLVSGTGLREGLLQDTLGIDIPPASEVLQRQTESLLAFHTRTPQAHFHQISRYAEQLYKAIDKDADPAVTGLVKAACMLYKIGGAIRYHQYDKHTLYWLTHAPLGALNHREAILCAFIADFPSNHAKKLNLEEYAELLKEKDEEEILRLGSLVELSIALDAGETQKIEEMETEITEDTLLLKLKSRSHPYLETRQLEAAVKNFKKAWGRKLEWELQPASMR